MAREANRGRGARPPVHAQPEAPLSEEVLRSKRIAHLYLGTHRDADKGQLHKVAVTLEEFLSTHPGQSAVVLVEAYETPTEITQEVHKRVMRGISVRQAFLDALTALQRSQGDQASYQQITSGYNQDNEFVSQALREYDAVSRKHPGRVQLLFEPFPDELAPRLRTLMEKWELMGSISRQALEAGNIKAAAFARTEEIIAFAEHTRIRENAIVDAVAEMVRQNDEALISQGSGKKPFRIGFVTGYYGAAHTKLLDLFDERGFDAQATYPQLRDGETFTYDYESALIRKVADDPSYASKITLEDATRAVFSQAVFQLLDTHSATQPSDYQQVLTLANQKIDAALPVDTPRSSAIARLFSRRGQQQSSADTRKAFYQTFGTVYEREKEALQQKLDRNVVSRNDFARAALKDGVLPEVMSAKALTKRLKNMFNITDDEITQLVNARALARTMNSIFDLGLSFSM